MIESFEIKGLRGSNSFTFNNNFGSWWAVSGLQPDRYKALFDWVKNDEGFWKAHTINATVEFKAKASDGTPMEGKVISIDIKDKV